MGKDAIIDAIAADTLFIHGSTSGGGGTIWTGGRGGRDPDYDEIIAEGCTEACGSTGTWAGEGPPGTSTVCDPTCSVDGYGESGRFGGHLCGAGDESKYGPACRTCYTDLSDALAADRELGDDGNSKPSGKHVIMCDTVKPPQDTECSAACSKQRDTVSEAVELVSQ